QDKSFFRARQPPQPLPAVRPSSGGTTTTAATHQDSPGDGSGVPPSSGAGTASAASLLSSSASSSAAAVAAGAVSTGSVVRAEEDGSGSSSGGGGGGDGSGGVNSSLWRLLCRELGLSESQEAQFLKFQRAAAEEPETVGDRDSLARLSRVLADLRVSTEACMASVHARAKMLMEVLTPSQMVRYLCWVAKTAAPADDRSDRSSACPLSSLMVATAGGAGGAFVGAGGEASTALAVARPSPMALTPPRRESHAEGAEGAARRPAKGEREEVLRLWRKPTEDLSLEEMEWLMGWVRRTQQQQQQQQ
ncbi:unnamed protein product, partial [Hapterophycus canaliculatus]